MKIDRKLLLIFLIIALTVLNTVTSYEDKESLHKRINYYNKISEFSNNTIKVGVSETRGLSCVANDFIEAGQKIVEIPIQHSLLPFSLYPFKYEIVEALLEIPGMKELISKKQKMTIYVLTYYILYFVFAPKEDIKTYIKEKHLEQYYKYPEPEESIKDSFPKFILNAAGFEKEHYDLMRKLRFKLDKDAELDGVFRHVNHQIYTSEHAEMIFPWTSNFEQFKWAYSLVVSRAITVRFDAYLILEGVKPYNKLDKWEKKNYDLNKFITNTLIGAPCIVPFVDLCNHYQSKYFDSRDARPIVLDTIHNYIVFSVGPSYRPEQEVTHNYLKSAENSRLLLSYGFIIPNNIFNKADMTVEIDTTRFSLAQFYLCKELGCVDEKIVDIRSIPRVMKVEGTVNKVNEDMINYARVKLIKGTFDQKTVMDLIRSGKGITYQNEIASWLFYFQKWLNFKNIEAMSLMKSIRKAQVYRNKVKNLEANWIDEEYSRNEWIRNKIFENIYLNDISYKKIPNRHLLASINHIILNANTELNTLRSKYLTN